MKTTLTRLKDYLEDNRYWTADSLFNKIDELLEEEKAQINAYRQRALDVENGLNVKKTWNSFDDITPAINEEIFISWSPDKYPKYPPEFRVWTGDYLRNTWDGMFWFSVPKHHNLG